MSSRERWRQAVKRNSCWEEHGARSNTRRGLSVKECRPAGVVHTQKLLPEMETKRPANNGSEADQADC